MTFKYSFLILLILPTCLYSESAPLSPLSLSNGGIPLLKNDIFSMGFQMNHSKKSFLGLYYAKPYFHFDIKTIHATYLRISNHYFSGIDLRMDDINTYSYKHIALKNGIHLKLLQVNCSLAYEHIKIPHYKQEKKIEGCLTFLTKINKKISTVFCLKSLSTDSNIKWNSQLNMNFSLQNSSELNVFLDKGSLLKEGIAFAFCHQLRDSSKIMFGLNYKCSRIGFGYIKQYKNIHLQLGISYHQILGSGISNAIIYEI